LSRPPNPCRPIRAAAVFLAAALPFAAAAGDADDALAALRRALREEGPRSSEAARLAGTVEQSGGLPAVRFRAARIEGAVAAEDLAAAAALAEGFDGTPLGLPTLGAYLRIEAADAGVDALLAYASAESYEPFARDALGSAARKARTAAEKAAVRSAFAAWETRGVHGSRAAIDRAVSLARVAASPADARALRLALARAVPDAPERAPDAFDTVDLTEWNAALRAAPEDVRLARARSLVFRSPKEALGLLPKAPATPSARLDAADVRLAAGETKDALRLLRVPAPLAFADEPSALRARALALVAEMRLLTRTSPAARSARRAAARRGKATPPPAPRALTPAEAARAAGLLASADELLATPLREVDRRRLVSDGARLALLAGRRETALRLLASLVLLDPSSGAAADELFRAAFDAYRAGRPAEAATLFDEIGAVYREPAIRRRATYWSARSREKAGDAAAARPLFASLLPGTSADVYALWAARALDVSLPGAPERPAPESAPSAGEEAVPGPRARELLACGLSDLAEDAAEADGLDDPVFHALLASERGDHRRAAVLLKQRWPELGTPEEGSVPPSVRRAFYPLGHFGVVRDAVRSAGVPEALVLGLIRQESVFSTDIRSRAGAVGLMQLMPATGRALHRREKRKGRPDLADPAVNVRLGVAYLKELLDRFDGDLVLVLSAYNAGPGRARRWKKELASLPPDEFVESIPLPESRHYVKRVLFFEGAYAALYGLPLEVPVTIAPKAAPVTP
jgi:soluble lytic murein transglycosylase